MIKWIIFELFWDFFSNFFFFYNLCSDLEEGICVVKDEKIIFECKYDYKKKKKKYKYKYKSYKYKYKYYKRRDKDYVFENGEFVEKKFKIVDEFLEFEKRKVFL